MRPFQVDSEHIKLRFQEGVIPEVGVNGASIEDVIAVLHSRLAGFEAGPLACLENRAAMLSLDQAANWLAERRKARIRQGVEGTYEPHR